MRRQEILVKSQRRQMGVEMRKRYKNNSVFTISSNNQIPTWSRQATSKQLLSAQERLDELERMLKVIMQLQRLIVLS